MATDGKETNGLSTGATLQTSGGSEDFPRKSMRRLPKLDVAGSTPVARSTTSAFRNQRFATIAGFGSARVAHHLRRFSWIFRANSAGIWRQVDRPRDQLFPVCAYISVMPNDHLERTVPHLMRDVFAGSRRAKAGKAVRKTRPGREPPDRSCPHAALIGIHSSIPPSPVCGLNSSPYRSKKSGAPAAFGTGCRMPAFLIFQPAPSRLIGAFLLLAMTAGFVTADHVLPPAKTLVGMSRP